MGTTITGFNVPSTLSNFEAKTTGTGTYSVNGKEYTYYNLEFEITAKDGRKVTWKCCADAVNGTAQAAILGLGALIKKATEKYHDSKQLLKALKGGAEGDPLKAFSFGADVETLNEKTCEQRITYHLFEKGSLNARLRPAFWGKERTVVVLDNAEIAYLKKLAEVITKTADGLRPTGDAEHRIRLRRAPEHHRIHLQPLRTCSKSF